ncbi:MAG: hypothetical protein KGI89_14305 [Euryarchaeota archaeon]|nr:hypothetical protein [Euryarchaeota archaeon]
MISLVVPVALVAALLAMFFLPFNSVSQEIQVSSASPATGTLTIPRAGWVTVHIDHPGGMPMHFWMGGEGGSGMMHDMTMMNGAASYSFWSNGGTYPFGAECSSMMGGTMPVWVNATWGAV